MVPIQSNRIRNSTWSEIQSPSNAKMASHLTFFFAAGLAFAPPTHRTRVQRENFLSVFPRCAAKSARSDVSREKNSNPTAGNRPLFARFKRGGAKNAASKKRVAKRALFSSETCAVPFSSLEASLLPWVSLVCVVFITRGVVKPNAIEITPFEGRKGLESCCFFFVPFFLHFFHWASSIDFLLPELPPPQKKKRTPAFLVSLSLSLDRNVFNSIN